MAPVPDKSAPPRRTTTPKGARGVSRSPAAPAPRQRSPRAAAPAPADVPAYRRSQGVDAYLQQIHDATPMQLVETERRGIAGAFLTDLSQRMDLPSSRLFTMLRIPKATAARKATEGAVIDGRAGQAAIGMARLLGMARELVQDSTAEGAEGFDAVKWLGQWLERPQPALGGRRPADLMDTPTGMEMVARLLGSIRSGAYQ